jgi:hypothetical protein
LVTWHLMVTGIFVTSNYIEINKKQMYQLYGIDYYKDLALNHEDLEIRRTAKRVLSIFGVNGMFSLFSHNNNKNQKICLMNLKIDVEFAY